MKTINRAFLREPPQPVDPQAPTWVLATMDGTTKWTSLAIDYKEMDLISLTLQVFPPVTGAFTGTGTFTVQASDEIPPPGSTPQNWNPPEGSWFTAPGLSGPLTVNVTAATAYNLSTGMFAPRWARIVWDPGSLTTGSFQIRFCDTGKGPH